MTKLPDEAIEKATKQYAWSGRMSDALKAAYPAIEKQVRAEVAASDHETIVNMNAGDPIVRIWTSQHHVIQHLRKDKRFTETTGPSRCTTEEAEFTIPRTEWTPWGGAKHRRQLTDEQQIMEQVAADIREYWPFRRTARPSKHSEVSE